MKLFITTALLSTALVPVAFIGASAQPQQRTESASAPTSQPRQTTASELRGKPVVDADGRQVGLIQRILVSDDGQSFAVIRFNDEAGLAGGPRLAPLSRLSMRGERLSLTGDASDWKQLKTYAQGREGYSRADGQRELTLTGDARQPLASRIIVQQPALRVQQGTPRITVQQAQPTVTVSQGQPEIVIHQPQPTVRVEIPQPRITVRLPEPDVNVETARPQVDVRQPSANVRTTRSGQEPQVQVDRQASAGSQRGQAHVNMQWAEGQPRIRYESSQPHVVVNQPQGQPSVHIERIAGDARRAGEASDRTQDQTQPGQKQQVASADRQSSDNGQASAAQSRQQAAATRTDNEQTAHRMTNKERDEARARLRVDEPQQSASAAAMNRNVPTRVLAVGDFNDMTVFNARGEKLGDVGSVVTNGYNRFYVVVEQGGFLGIGDDEVAFPIERFWVKDDALVIRGVTEDDIDRMDDYRGAAENYRQVADGAVAELKVWQ